MTRRQAFDTVIARMQKPENREKYYGISLHPKDSDQPLCWHLTRARISLEAIGKDNTNTELLKSDFDVSIRHVQQILDQQGWA